VLAGASEEETTIMPIPDEQKRRLQIDLVGHERRLSFLRQQIERLEKEAAVHEVLLGLGRDKRLSELMNELYDHPELAAEIARQPARYIEGRGIKLPHGAEIIVVEASAGDTALEAHFKQQGYAYKVAWSRNKGFSSDRLDSSP
jgi:hypothetical protein